MKTVWRVFAYLKRYPWLAAGTLTCAIVGTLMVIVFPSVTKWIIDNVIRTNRPDKLLPLILLAIFAFLVQHVFNSLRIILNNTFEQKVIFDLRSDLYSHIQLLPLRWFDNRATGDLMTRVIEDVNSVERVLIDGIEQGVVAVLQILIVLCPTRSPRIAGTDFSAALHRTSTRCYTITLPEFVRSKVSRANARNTGVSTSPAMNCGTLRWWSCAPGLFIRRRCQCLKP